MSTPVSEVLQDAYLFAGIGDQYNPMDADSTNLALRFLNDLADSCSIDALKIFGLNPLIVPLTVGIPHYFFGPVMAQPPDQVQTLVQRRLNVIDSVSIHDAADMTYPVKIMDATEYQRIVYKKAAGRPELVHEWQRGDNDATAQHDSTILSFWPTPSFAGDVAHIYEWYPAQQFTSVGDSLIAPAGYRLFFKTALGKLLASVNKIPLSKDQNDVIAAAELTMKARNARRRILGNDIPQDSEVHGRFNIFTGYPR